MSKYKTIDLGRYSAVFQALANPHRLQIYNILSGCCEPGTPCSADDKLTCCVGDLNEQLEIASSTLSHHLKELNRAELVDMRRRGKQVLCSVNPLMLEEIRNFFGHTEPARP